VLCPLWSGRWAPHGGRRFPHVLLSVLVFTSNSQRQGPPRTRAPMVETGPASMKPKGDDIAHGQPVVLQCLVQQHLPVAGLDVGSNVGSPPAPYAACTTDDAVRSGQGRASPCRANSLRADFATGEAATSASRESRPRSSLTSEKRPSRTAIQTARRAVRGRLGARS
jgi:hypothetical protein